MLDQLGDIALMMPIGLTGEISVDLADAVVAQLRENAGRPVVLEIAASEGGCAASSRRICGAVARHGDVHAEITHEASSGAALVWLSSSTRAMKFGSSVRFHYARVLDFFLAQGGAAVFREIAEDLEETDIWIRGLITAATGMSEMDAHQLLVDDRRLDRAAARALGFWG